MRLQPNHPTDDPREIAASILDGLMLSTGDAVIEINPASDSPERAHALLSMLDEESDQSSIFQRKPVCWPTSPRRLNLIHHGSPIDLVFQSIAGTEAANRSFGIHIGNSSGGTRGGIVASAQEYVGNNVMYFETAQGKRTLG